jgi:hypothetical protein
MYKVWVKLLSGLPIRSTNPAHMALEPAKSNNLYFREELPELMTSTFIFSTFAQLN